LSVNVPACRTGAAGLVPVFNTNESMLVPVAEVPSVRLPMVALPPVLAMTPKAALLETVTEPVTW